MPYGQTDYSQLNRIDRAVSDFTDDQIKLGSQAFALLRQKADQQNAMETLRWVADQNFAKQAPKDALETVTKATTMLSKTGGPYSQQAAQQLHGLVTAKMGLDKLDTNLTEGDLAYRAAGGDTTAANALGLMQKGKKPESSFLRTEKTVVNGVTKLADIYGYKNPQGTEVVTERKYQDFTPSASSQNAGAKEVEAIKKRIATITKTNQELGQQMRKNSQSANALVVDKEGKKISEDSDLYKTTKQNLQIANEGLAQRIRDNEALLEDLNSQIGGKFKAGQQATQIDQSVATEDQQAIDWAKSNPNDPRAAKILQLHGIK